MIKKNTTIIFKDGTDSNKLVGGMPLFKGEIVRLHKDDTVAKYIVEEKTIDIIMNEEDQIVNIVYILTKK